MDGEQNGKNVDFVIWGAYRTSHFTKQVDICTADLKNMQATYVGKRKSVTWGERNDQSIM